MYHSSFTFYLSDDKKHDWAYTAKVLIDIIAILDPSPIIIRIQPDNCSCQYKCKWVFGFYCKLSQTINKTIIIYNGAAGHWKGLVDAMSTFGVKDALRTAIITEDFFYKSAEDIYNLITDKKSLDETKSISICMMMLLNKKEWKHMLSFFPDGSVETKRNMCSCEFSLQGQFVSCEQQKGTILFHNNEDSDQMKHAMKVATMRSMMK